MIVKPGRMFYNMVQEERYTGRILAVGIGYDRRQKTHACRVEVLRG